MLHSNHNRMGSPVRQRLRQCCQEVQELAENGISHAENRKKKQDPEGRKRSILYTAFLRGEDSSSRDCEFEDQEEAFSAFSRKFRFP